MPNLNTGHRQRLKERFLKSGFDDFEYHNMLELLLFFTIPRKDTNQTAHNLINRFGSFSAVFNASFEELIKVDGVGRESATLIKVAAALVRPYIEDLHNDGMILDTTEKLCNYLIPKYIGRTNEVTYIVCLDNKRKCLFCDMLNEGTIDSVPIFTRQIAEIALRTAATYVVISHNHPNTFALPSIEDIQTTKRLKAALDTLSIKLLDHIIVSREDAVSMADSGCFLEF